MASDTAAPTEPLRCPECGSVITVEWLVIEDEAEYDELLFFSCPQDDFMAHATKAQAVELAARLVATRILQEWQTNPR